MEQTRRILLLLLLLSNSCWAQFGFDDPAFVARLNAGAYDVNVGLVAHWKLDEASGNRNDSWSTNHLVDTNSVVGLPFVKDNGAFINASAPNSLFILDNAALSLTNFTITYWVKHTNVAVSQYHVSKALSAGNYSFFSYLEVGTGRFRFHASSNGTELVDFVQANTASILANSTNFVVIERNAVAGTLRIGVNGAAMTSTNHVTAVFDSTSPFVLGAQTPAGAFPLRGFLDEVRVYNRVLSDDLINRLYTLKP